MTLRTCLAPAPVHAPGAAAAVPPAADTPLSASGAGPAHWGSRHHAWQDAIDTHPGDALPGKEPLPVGVMIAIAEHGVRAIRELRDALEQNPGLRQRIGALQPHARDARGRNWNIPLLACGTLPRASDEADFRRVVNVLRDRFDLA